MTWELNIKKAENGFICEWEDEEDGCGTVIKNEVIEDNDTDFEENIEIDTMIKLLNKVKEFYGVHYSKHNKRNLVIKVEETYSNRATTVSEVLD